MKEKLEKKLRGRKIEEDYTDSIIEDNLLFIQKAIEVENRKFKILADEAEKLGEEMAAGPTPAREAEITAQLGDISAKLDKRQAKIDALNVTFTEAQARQTDKTDKDTTAKTLYDQRMKDSSFNEKALKGHGNQTEIDARLAEKNTLEKYNYGKKKGKLTSKEYDAQAIKRDILKREHRETELIDMKAILADYKTAKEEYLRIAQEDATTKSGTKKFFINLKHRLGIGRRDKNFGVDTKVAKTEHERLFAEKFEQARTELRGAVKAKLETRGSTLIEKYKGTDKEIAGTTEAAIDAIVERYDSIMLVNHMIGREVDNIKAAEKEIFSTTNGKKVSRFFAKAGHIVSFGGIENKKVRKVVRFAASTVVFGLAGGAFGSLVSGATYVGTKIARTVASGTAGTFANKGTKITVEKIAKKMGKYTTIKAINEAYQAKTITLGQYVEEKRKLEKFENLVKTLKTATGITAGIGTSMATSVSINNHFGGNADNIAEEHAEAQKVVSPTPTQPSQYPSATYENPIDKLFGDPTPEKPEGFTLFPDAAAVDEDTIDTIPAPANVDDVFDNTSDEELLGTDIDDASFDEATGTETVTTDPTIEDGLEADADGTSSNDDINDVFDNSSEDELLGTDLDDKTFDDIIEGRKTAVSAKDIIGDTESEKVFEVTVEKGKGAISMFRELQKDLLAKHPDFDPETAPDGPLKDLMTKDPHDLAIKYNYYNPEDINESAHIGIGDKLVFNEETGQFLHETANPNDTNYLLEKGDGSESGQFDGKFADNGGKHGALGDHDTPRTAPPTVNVDTQQEVAGDGAPYAKHFYDVDQNRPIPASAVAAQNAAENATSVGTSSKIDPTTYVENGATAQSGFSKTLEDQIAIATKTFSIENVSAYKTYLGNVFDSYNIGSMSAIDQQNFVTNFTGVVDNIFGYDDELGGHVSGFDTDTWYGLKGMKLTEFYAYAENNKGSLTGINATLHEYFTTYDTIKDFSFIKNPTPDATIESTMVQLAKSI